MKVVFAWSLCFSVAVVLLSIIPLTIGRVRAGYSVKNMSAPRALFNELPDFGKRAVWCHQNCWESISIYAPACLLCLIGSTDSNSAIIAALCHPVLRFLYIGAYIFDIPLARGLMWAGGIFTTLLLYKEGLTQFL
tara:strand:- start:902 stop:1306 length:405 start_codon:yes stop_codon:yes gene_type:complete